MGVIDVHGRRMYVLGRRLRDLRANKSRRFDVGDAGRQQL